MFDDIWGDISERGEEKQRAVLYLRGGSGSDGVDEDVGADTGIEVDGFGVLVGR